MYSSVLKQIEHQQWVIERLCLILEKQAEQEPEPVKDSSNLTKVIKAVALVALIIIFILACIVLFWSADEKDYIVNREIFYKYAFIGTLIYFITAYWALKRSKIKNDKS